MPKLPPANFSFVFSALSAFGAVIIGKVIPWQHYGIEFQILDDGTITTVPPSNDGMIGFVRSLPDLSFDDHPSSQYYGLLVKNVMGKQHTAQDEAVIAIMVGLF